MTSDQIKNSESIVADFVNKDSTVYAKEAPLPIAKEIQGLRAIFEEVTAKLLSVYMICVLPIVNM
jgi:alanyl-tRNA synthetase